MKILILLFFIIFSFCTFANDCKGLSDDLVTIQYQLETKQLYSCTDKIKRFCKNPDDPDTGKTIYQAKMEYNQALAELTLHEGLISIGSAIEGKHNALKAITSTQIKQAKDDIEDFQRSFMRGKILQKSLERNGDNSLWDEYVGETSEDMQAYLNKLCVKPKAYQTFCLELAKAQKSTTPLQWREVVETLQGFSESDHRILKTDRDSRYDRYQNYLKVKINGQLKDLDELETNGSYQKVKELKILIESYEKTKSENTLKVLMSKSKEIDEIDINFNANIDLSVKFSDFAKSSFEKETTKLHSASGLFLNINKTKDNFHKIQKTMDTELAQRKVTLDKEIQKFSSNLEGKCDKGDKYDCIKRLCRPNPSSGECTQSQNNKELIAADLDTLYKKVKVYNDSKQVATAVSNINKGCFQGERKKITVLQKCLEKTLSKLKDFKESDCKKKREKLAQKKKVLDYLSSGSPIKDLEIKKAMTVNALVANKCINKRDKLSSLEFTSECYSGVGTNTSKEIIELGKGASKIVSDLNMNLYNQFQKTQSGYSEEYKRERLKLLKKCTKDSSSSHLCKFLEKEYRVENTKVVVKPISRQLRRSLRRTTKEYEDNEPGPWTYIGIGVANLAVAGTFAYMQYDAEQTQFEMQMDAFRDQSEQNERYNEYVKDYLEKQAEYEQQFFINSLATGGNWGHNFYNPLFAQNFNQGNQNLFYRPSFNFNQLTFPSTTFSSSSTLLPVQNR